MSTQLIVHFHDCNDVPEYALNSCGLRCDGKETYMFTDGANNKNMHELIIWVAFTMSSKDDITNPVTMLPTVSSLKPYFKCFGALIGLNFESLD